MEGAPVEPETDAVPGKRRKEVLGGIRKAEGAIKVIINKVAYFLSQLH